MSYRSSFASKADMSAFIDQAISESNTGYSNSKVPITLALHCTVDSTITDNPSLGTVLDNFYNSAGKKNRKSV
jgi:hypothetical protein